MSLQNNDRLLIGCIYRSPNNSVEENCHLADELIYACQKNYSHVLIASNFNHPEIDWTTCSTGFDLNHKASKFLECIKDCYLYQHITEPTHHRENQQPNILDLVFTNEENMIQSILMMSPLGRSHHNGLSFKFQCYLIDGSISPTRPLYDKGNYDEIRNGLKRVDWNTELKGKNKEDTFAYIKAKLEEEVKKHIPISRPRKGHKTKALWMSLNALTKVKRKNAAYRRYLRTAEGKDYVTYVRARNQAKWEIRKAKRDYEKKLARESKINPKAFLNMPTQN